MNNSGKWRTYNYKSQIKLSIIYKLFVVFSLYASVPILIDYLGVEAYGVWATLLTFISWSMLFDLGIGNGLKNRVSELAALEDFYAARKFVSTAYLLVLIISTVLLLIFGVLAFHLSWRSVFNASLISEEELRFSVLLLFFFLCANFVVGLIAQIYHGLQRSSGVVLGQFISSAIALLGITALWHLCPPYLPLVVAIYGGGLLISNVSLSYSLFKIHPILIPSINAVDLSKVRKLFSIGAKFFIIQLSVLVVFMVDRLLVSHLLGASTVASYEVVFRLFSVFTVLQGLILAPLWPAFTDSYRRNDLLWIRQKIKVQMLLCMAFSLGAFALSFCASYIVKVWVGTEVVISTNLYISFAILTSITIWNSVFACFVNAIDALNLQLCTAVLAMLVNIPLSIYLVKCYGMGAEGVVLGTAASLVFFAVLGPLQAKKILKA